MWSKEFTARARLVGHYGSSIGGDIEEYKPAVLRVDRPGFIVVKHHPTLSRPYFTYATAGVSLWAQSPGGPQPRLELLAYSPAESERVVEALVVLANQILSVSKHDMPYKVYDTVDLSGAGLTDEKFVLAPPIEADDLVRFPDAGRRIEDLRFTQAITENVDDPVEVAFIHVVPVTDDELAFANARGTQVLLEKMDLERRGKAFGWGRSARDSVLKRGGFWLRASK